MMKPEKLHITVLGEKALSIWNPCSSFASKGWRIATGEKLKHRHWLGIGYSDPNVLANSIKMQNKKEAMSNKTEEKQDETK